MATHDKIKDYARELEKIADYVKDLEEKCKKLEKENEKLFSELRSAQSKK